MAHNVDVIIRARDMASKTMNKVGMSGLNMGQQLKQAAVLIGSYFGARAIGGFLKESVQLFNRQEMAVNKLSSALELMGENNKGTLLNMQRFAAENSEC